MENYFSNYINILLNYQIDPSYILPMVLKVFNLNIKINEENRRKAIKQNQRLYSLIRHISYLQKKYFNELRENGYAMLSVLSDFATSPPKSLPPAFSAAQLRMDRFQKKSKPLD